MESSKVYEEIDQLLTKYPKSTTKRYEEEDQI